LNKVWGTINGRAQLPSNKLIAKYKNSDYFKKIHKKHTNYNYLKKYINFKLITKMGGKLKNCSQFVISDYSG
jgi:hypothetical protein